MILLIIVVLLLLILCTMLFGAKAVRHGVGQTIAVLVGGGLLLFAIMWIGSAFGKDGTTAAFWIVVGVLMIAAIATLPKPTKRQ